MKQGIRANIGCPRKPLKTATFGRKECDFMARPSLAEKDILRFQKKSPQTGRERKDRWKIYHIDGKPHFVYSWKLEKQVNTDLDLLVNIVDMSVFEGLV